MVLGREGVVYDMVSKQNDVRVGGVPVRVGAVGTGFWVVDQWDRWDQWGRVCR